jgi:hypothetical protein
MMGIKMIVKGESGNMKYERGYLEGHVATRKSNITSLFILDNILLLLMHNLLLYSYLIVFPDLLFRM